MRQFQISVHSLMSAYDCPTRTVSHLAGYRDSAIDAENYRSLDAGTAAHTALAAWLRGENWLDAIDYYRDYSTEHGMVDDRRGYDNLVNVLSSVFNRHPIERLPFIVDKHEMVEVPFAYPLGTVTVGGEEIGVNLIGYIDALGIDRRSRGNYVIEHKTTGNLNATYIWKFTHTDPQTTAYIWAVQKTTGEAIRDCWVNAIQLTQVPSSDRKCKDHGRLYAECGPEHVKQTFVQVKRTDEQLEEFAKNALTISKEVIKSALFLEKRGPEAAVLKAPTYGKIFGNCEFCDIRRWCAVSNKQVDLMKTMLTIPINDSDRLRTGFVS